MSEAEYLERLLEATLKIADWAERTEKARQEVEERRAAQLEEIMERQSALLDTLRETIKYEARMSTAELRGAIDAHAAEMRQSIEHHADRTVPQVEDHGDLELLDDDDDDDDLDDADIAIGVVLDAVTTDLIPTPTDQAFWLMIKDMAKAGETPEFQYKQPEVIRRHDFGRGQ